VRREDCFENQAFGACKKLTCGDGLFMPERPEVLRGRGAGDNQPNRFEKVHLERDEDWNPVEDPSPKTQFLRDLSQSIISYNDSPDIPFNASLNSFRGCEHGCSYCFSQTTHETPPSLCIHLHRRNEQLVPRRAEVLFSEFAECLGLPTRVSAIPAAIMTRWEVSK
jgi:hypothetical protein